LAILYGDEWYYRTWAALLHSVRTGQSAFEHVHGLSLFDYLNQHPEAGTVFNDAMTSYSAQETAAILDAYDFAEITHVVDVGGGHGRLFWRQSFEHTQKCEAHSSISQP
jgi:O-methyltransferase domain